MRRLQAWEGLVLLYIRTAGAPELGKRWLAGDIGRAERGITEDGTELGEAAAGEATELPHPHGADREEAVRGRKKGDKPLKLGGAVGAGGDFKNHGAGGHGGLCLGAEGVYGRGIAEMMAGKDKGDLAAANFGEQRLHLPDGSELEINPGGVAKKALQESVASGRAEVAATALGGMARGEEERGVQPGQGALDRA